VSVLLEKKLWQQRMGDENLKIQDRDYILMAQIKTHALLTKQNTNSSINFI
jgi:hypothetical protein